MPRGRRNYKRKRMTSAERYRSLAVEKKFFDYALTASAIANPTDATGGEKDPATINCLNGVNQGDGESRRDGRQMVMDSLIVHGRITSNSQSAQLGADNSTKVFVAVVLDKQTNKVQLNSEDVFANPSASNTTAADPFRNLQNVQRFRVLKSKTFTLETSAIASTETSGSTTSYIQAGVEKSFKFYIPLKGMEVNFVSVNGNCGDISDNSIHLIAYCTSTALSPEISYQARLRYYG